MAEGGKALVVEMSTGQLQYVNTQLVGTYFLGGTSQLPLVEPQRMPKKIEFHEENVHAFNIVK